MGSRRRRYAALVALFVGGCAAASAPPGFPAGDHWSIPLIGPLEDGLLLVPGLVNGKGPYVFAIDLDAQVSIVDQQIVKETGARTGEGPALLDENATAQPRFYAEILEWKLGTLRLEQKPAQIVPTHTFDAAGRRIHGVIGRDIIPESLVFGFDRDRGVAIIATQRRYDVPDAAIRIKYSKLASTVQHAEVLPAPRAMVKAVIAGERFAMHLDLGAVPSQLRPRSWSEAKLVESELRLGLVDDAGIAREITRQGLANEVALANMNVTTGATKSVVFVPFVDKRWPDQQIDGTLGLGFLQPYVVMLRPEISMLYVWQRADVMSSITARVARWQSKTLMGCPHLGCVKVTLIDPVAGRVADAMPAKHPGLVASFKRDPSAVGLDLELLVAVTAAAGNPALPWLVVNLPAGADRAMTHLSSDYLGASLSVVDVSLFPRACPAEGGCVDMLAAPRLTQK